MALGLLLKRRFLSFVSIFSPQFHLQLVTILEQLEKKDYKHNNNNYIKQKYFILCSV